MGEVETIQKKAYDNGLNLTRLDYQLSKKQLKLIGAGQKVLDIGCNEGSLTKIISEKNKVIGMELSSKALKKAKNKGLEVICASAYQIPFKKNTFTRIHFSEVIEHLINTDKALKEINRVLTKDGELIITTPNFNSLRDRLLVLSGRLQAYAQHEEHVRIFNKKRLIQHLEKNNFKIKKTHGTGISIPMPKGLSPVTTKLDKILPATMMQRLIIIAQKRQ